MDIAAMAAMETSLDTLIEKNDVARLRMTYLGLFLEEETQENGGANSERRFSRNCARKFLGVPTCLAEHELPARIETRAVAA